MIVATHILLATDFSEASRTAIQRAAEMARQSDAKLTVLHVHGHPPEPPEANVPAERIVFSADLDADAHAALEELKRTLLADVEWTSVATVEHGRSAQAICDYAREHGVDLIIMGSHGRTGLAHLLLGSVAEKVVKHAPCAVMVVPNAAAAAA
jgi:nucleotide-binding universal stress UspA family protein